MGSSGQGGHSHDEGEGDLLRASAVPDAVPIDLVSAFAGDRNITRNEGARIRELKGRRGNVFFSDLLYSISHRYFAPEIAEDIWNNILSHKLMMSAKLGRNVRIAVATLDYLSSITGETRPFCLISETRVAEVVNLSMRDGMTGLFNQSACYELLELELSNYRRYSVGVALILMDIDNFKSINDRWGHQEGDRILLELATTLKKETRDSDICCRFGGEEFAVILPFTNEPRDAFKIAERIRSGTTKIMSSGQKITVSEGLALCDGSTQTSHTLVDRADRALCQAKRNGKNKVVVSDLVTKWPDFYLR
jgi:two-component system cell cycle response regulator